MPKMDQIHVFAVKWCDKFRDQTIHYIELVDHYMADDCEALGFVMDCGNAFAKRYGDAVSNVTALDKIIDEVKDISFWARRSTHGGGTLTTGPIPPRRSWNPKTAHGLSWHWAVWRY